MCICVRVGHEMHSEAPKQLSVACGSMVKQERAWYLFSCV